MLKSPNALSKRLAQAGVSAGKLIFGARDTFLRRHNGSNELEKAEMLKTIGLQSMNELIDQCVPGNIRRKYVCPLP